MLILKSRVLLLVFLSSFLYSSQIEIGREALNLKIYQKNEWKALLHYSKSLDIKDKNFIISKRFSLKNELEATIKAFYDSPKKYKDINNHPQCKFPARLLFISHELNISKNEFPKVNCINFNTYNEKAPADKISLIYASENVKNPSSMMGHTFLKFSGKNYKGREVEHAITFYTVIESQNPIVLIYQNLFPGMKGLFALQPYNEIVKQYTNKENRNIWDYQLKLSDYRRQLIYYHIWELKGIEMKYFFTSYNCSTVIYYTLSLAKPRIYDEKKLWITPLDTVKFLYQYDLIEKSELKPSNEWLIKMLLENLDDCKIKYIKNIIKKEQYKNIIHLDFLSLELLRVYSGFLYEKKSIKQTELQKIEQYIKKNKNVDNAIFDISQYKTPSKIPNERQFSIGFTHVNSQNYVKLSFLPASHLLNDDNREYFGESELKIFYLSLLANKNRFDLDEFTLYGMKSYIPYDSLTSDLSYQFEVSVKKEYTKKMDFLDTFKVNGGFGIDFLVAHDINLFGMLSFGIGYNNEEKTHILFYPKIGMMIYEILNMKTLAYYQPLFIGNQKVYDKYTINHNIFISNCYKVYLNIEKIDATKKELNYEFGISYLF